MWLVCLRSRVPTPPQHAHVLPPSALPGDPKPCWALTAPLPARELGVHWNGPQSQHSEGDPRLKIKKTKMWQNKTVFTILNIFRGFPRSSSGPQQRPLPVTLSDWFSALSWRYSPPQRATRGTPGSAEGSMKCWGPLHTQNKGMDPDPRVVSPPTMELFFSLRFLGHVLWCLWTTSGLWSSGRVTSLPEVLGRQWELYPGLLHTKLRD